MNPNGAFNLKTFAKQLHQSLELLIAVFKAMTKNQEADDVRDNVVHDEVWTEWLTFTIKQKIRCRLYICDFCIILNVSLCIHYSPLKLLKMFAQCVTSSKITGSSDFFPNPKYLRVESAKRLCCFHMCPLLKIIPDGKDIKSR